MCHRSAPSFRDQVRGFLGSSYSGCSLPIKNHSAEPHITHQPTKCVLQPTILLQNSTPTLLRGTTKYDKPPGYISHMRQQHPVWGNFWKKHMVSIFNLSLSPLLGGSAKPFFSVGNSTKETHICYEYHIYRNNKKPKRRTSRQKVDPNLQAEDSWRFHTLEAVGW